MARFGWLLLGAMLLTSPSANVSAQAPANVSTQAPQRPPRRLALGLQLDLFPTVVSAVDRNFGYAPQIWLGIDHVRIRLIGAHLEPPDALAFAPKGFTNPTTTVFAMTFDYTFGEHFDEWWVGTGFELWTNTIEHEGVTGHATWNTTIFTLGGGYIWRVVRNFYLDFWLGLHLAMNRTTVSLGGDDFETGVIFASGGLKIGYFFDL